MEGNDQAARAASYRLLPTNKERDMENPYERVPPDERNIGPNEHHEDYLIRMVEGSRHDAWNEGSASRDAEVTRHCEHTRLMPQLGFMCVKAGHRVYPELIVPDDECSDPRCSCHAGVEAPDDEWTFQFGQRDGGWQPPQTHTCYYCNHEGPCVNRIHSTEFTAWGRTQEIRYVCDDGDACDERFQSNTVDLEGAVRDIIRDVVLDVTREVAGCLYIRDEATARIMKLIELPFWEG